MKEEIVITEDNKRYKKSIILEVILDIIVYAVILMMCSSIFKNFYLENVWYAFLASTVIGLLNLIVKPFLVYITLPLTVLTLGLFYPFVNILVLKLASIFLGKHFIVEGWFVLFFISLFISIMKIIFELIIVRPIVERN